MMKENKTTEQVIKETGEAFTEGMAACAIANVATNVTGEVVRDNGTEKVAKTEEQKETLIRPLGIQELAETVHADFVSRLEFINRTGIFVTPSFFEYIYGNFKERGVSAKEFVENYETKYAECVIEVPLHGNFKYEIQDDRISCICSEHDDLSIWEIINNLVEECESEHISKYALTSQYRKIAEELLERLKGTIKTMQDYEDTFSEMQKKENQKYAFPISKLDYHTV